MTLTLDAATCTLDVALYYAQLGWRVVPILPGTKRPGIEAWQDVATTDPQLIADWWTRWPGHGLGIATGRRSNLLVLDVDPAHGGDDSLATLEGIGLLPRPMPDTVEAITGGGGRHLLFRFPALPDGKRLGNSAGKLGPGLDIRASGGQIVAFPTLHPDTGRRYEWEMSSRPGEVEVAEAPAWLVELLTEDVDIIPEGQLGGAGADLTYAWDRYSHAEGANARAVDLLEAHGWHTPRADRTGTIYMTRPGKAPGQGSGVSIGRVAPGVTFCFTSEAPPLEAEHGYGLAALYAELNYDGDRTAADDSLVALGWGRPSYNLTATIEPYVAAEHARALAMAGMGTGADVEPRGPQPVDWPAFWERERRDDDWAIPQVVPAGRLITVWAARKTGKSLFVLDIAAAAATGRSILGGESIDPISVMYLDMEMTEDDLEERLGDLGYGPAVDLSLFHYYLLPTLPPLDTAEGGLALMELVRRHDPQVVVIDTMARVVSGEENNADTYRAFYRATGMLLKQAGVACVRLDHAGKDKTKGERGSSAKGDDVDLSWELAEVGGGEYMLKRSYTRISWVPEAIGLQRELDPLRHVAAAGGGWPAGVRPCADHLDALGVPLEASVTKAVEHLRDAGVSPRGRVVVGQALKFRRTKRPGDEETAAAIENMRSGEGERPENAPWGETGTSEAED